MKMTMTSRRWRVRRRRDEGDLEDEEHEEEQDGTLPPDEHWPCAEGGAAASTRVAASGATSCIGRGPDVPIE